MMPSAAVALHRQLENLHEAIADLLQIALEQPPGELRDQLVLQVSCLDSIADVTRRVVSCLDLGRTDRD